MQANSKTVYASEAVNVSFGDDTILLNRQTSRYYTLKRDGHPRVDAPPRGAETVARGGRILAEYTITIAEALANVLTLVAELKAKGLLHGRSHQRSGGGGG